MTDMTKIKERISRLLAMAADESSPHEAAIAARRARALLDKYQIDEFELGEIKAEFGQARDELGAVVFMALWRQSLAIKVARFNDCNVAYFAGWTRTKKLGKYFVFQGYAADAEMALEMYNRLAHGITTKCSEWMRAQGYTKYIASVGDKFKAAAAYELGARLDEATQHRMQHYQSQGTGLMVVKAKNVEEHFGAAEYHTTNKRAAETHDERAAAYAGHVTGRAIEITAGVE